MHRLGLAHLDPAKDSVSFHCATVFLAPLSLHSVQLASKGTCRRLKTCSDVTATKD